MKKLTAILCLFSFFNAGGQSLQVFATRPGADSVISDYFTSLGETLPIYNGRVFYGYPGVLEDGFYPSGGWNKGSIFFDGIWYHDISFMYDIHQDEVILLHSSNTPIRLISERIQQFKYQGFHFVRLAPDKDNVIKSGFYQRLVDGPVSILAKRTKKIEENIVDLAIERRFITVYQYIALKDGIYTPINKQKSLLDLLKDKRQAVLQHLKQQHLKFKKEKEKAIVEMTEFYNQTLKQ